MKNLLFLFLVSLFLIPSAFSQVKHIVFDIEGTLVQGIPQSNFSSFTNKDQMISVNDGKRLYYYIYPKVSHLIHVLQQKDQFAVHFVTNKSRAWANSVLKSINLPKPIQASLADYLASEGVNRLYTSEDFQNGKFDLKKITTDLSNVVLFSSNSAQLVPDSQMNQQFFIGKNLYYFETYEQASIERDKVAAAQKINFPSSEKEWFTEQNKTSYIFQLLAKAGASTTAKLTESLKRVVNDVPRLTREGHLVGRYDFQDQILLYKYNANKTKVLGCGIYNPMTDKYVTDRELSDCLAEYSSNYKFRFDKVADRAVACEMLDASTGAYIRDHGDFSKCIDSAEGKLRYHWAGKKKVSCGAYFDLMLVQNSEDHLCNDSHIVSEKGVKSIKYYFNHNDVLVEGIEEIFFLLPGGTVGSELYSSYDSRLIASSLLQWIRIQRNETSTSPADYDFMNDTRIVMAVSYKNLELIKKNGFLNQHETGSSGGAFSPSRRALVENSFLNLNLENGYGSSGKNVHKVRPKYSFLLLDKFRKDMGFNKIFKQYGNLFVVFKERLKSRSTFTPGDSLDMGATSKDVRTFWYRNKDVMKLVKNYYETQIWGELDLSEVDHFLVNCMETFSQDQINNIKSTGIPVFDCKASYDGGNSNPYNLTKLKKL